MFEDTTQVRGSRRLRGWPLAASLLLHLAAAGVLLLSAGRAPAPGEGERPIDVLLLRAAILGEAAPDAVKPLSPAAREAERERQAMLDRLVQPIVVPDAPGPAAPASGGTPAGGASAGGSGGPAESGTGAGSAEADLPVEAGGGVIRPEVIASSRVLPVYPEEAQRAGLQGLVVLKVEIDERGRVGAIEVLRGLGGGLDDAAVAAVRQWRFRPATRNGKPIKVFHVIPFDFHL